MASEIPVIDLQSCGLYIEKYNINAEDLKTVGDQIVQTMSTVGFCYLRNHGVPEKLIQDFMISSSEFFQQPKDFKQRFRRIKDAKDYTGGWVEIGRESADPQRSGDFKEAFNYFPSTSMEGWPEGFLPNFRQNLDGIFNTTTDLCVRVLGAISEGLGLEKENDLLKAHSLVGKPGNATQVRTVYYPHIGNRRDLNKDQVRLGEHFDFGTLTILFQDSTGGLEVCRKDGRYVHAVPMKGTCLLLAAECLQKWTADKITATKHRIMIPDDEAVLHSPRQCVLNFFNPDHDSIIRCLDGSEKYPPRAYKERFLELMDPMYSLN